MDGENNGKPLLKWMIWGKTHYFWKHPCTEFCPNQRHRNLKPNSMGRFFVSTIVDFEPLDFAVHHSHWLLARYFWVLKSPHFAAGVLDLRVDKMFERYRKGASF